jgi:hypothetical protein
MENDLAAARLAAHERLLAARTALRQSFHRWATAHESLDTSTEEIREAGRASEAAVAEYGQAVEEYVRLLDSRGAAAAK